MGEKGDPFTKADLYATAKHIASFPDWDRVVAKQRWDAYGAKVYISSIRSRSVTNVMIVPSAIREVLG